ncbi:hypothetical protein BDN67DRAFT_992715 [Paxillus ammoniavirescens]|nr:hypothetical protein BDN67DRAFT_992715 [Paxillus ammoniavirescens]
MARVGELTIKTLLLQLLCHIKPSNIQTEHDHQGNTVTNIHLPKLKSAPHSEDINWARQDSPSDPHAALKNHQRVNCPPNDGPLFACHNGKTHKPLTKGKRLPLQGHGIHISSTLEYLLRNVPSNIIKVKGRWVTQILTPYMQAQPSFHDSFLRLTLPPVR